MSVRIDVDVEYFMDECDSYDIEEIIDWLIENDHISKNGMLLSVSNNMNFDETELLKNLTAIREKYNSLSSDQLEVIKQMAS